MYWDFQYFTPNGSKCTHSSFSCTTHGLSIVPVYLKLILIENWNSCHSSRPNASKCTHSSFTCTTHGLSIVPVYLRLIMIKNQISSHLTCTTHTMVFKWGKESETTFIYFLQTLTMVHIMTTAIDS